jgi:hypothetical protein
MNCEKVVIRTRTQWLGKNVDLALLSKSVMGFFRGRNIETKMVKSAEKYVILAKLPQSSRGNRDIEIKIYGASNDFTVEFTTLERAYSSVKLGLLTTLFGGGGIVLHGVKLTESLEKLEEEFCAYLAEAVSQLTGSAT